MKKMASITALLLFTAGAAAAQSRVKPGAAKGPKGRNSVGRAEQGVATKKAGAAEPAVLRLGPSTTYLRNGLRLNEVLRVLGKPVSVSERQEGDRRLTVCIFPRSESRFFVAEFSEDVLVRSSTESADIAGEKVAI